MAPAHAVASEEVRPVAVPLAELLVACAHAGHGADAPVGDRAGEAAFEGEGGCGGREDETAHRDILPGGFRQWCRAGGQRERPPAQVGERAWPGGPVWLRRPRPR